MDSNTIDGYFQEYRKKLELLNDLKKTYQEVQFKASQDLDKIRAKQEKINNEINNMRRVITTIVDKGLDPVEAKLTVDHETAHSIWDTPSYDEVGNIFDELGIATCIPNAVCDISYSNTGTIEID